MKAPRQSTSGAAVELLHEQVFIGDPIDVVRSIGHVIGQPWGRHLQDAAAPEWKQDTPCECSRRHDGTHSARVYGFDKKNKRGFKLAEQVLSCECG